MTLALSLPNQYVAALKTQIVTIVLPILFIALRLYTRIVIVKSPGWDDYILTMGMLLNTAHGTAILGSLTHGAGMHQSDILRIYSMDDLQTILKIAFFCSIAQPWVMLSIKVSLQITYLRIFPGCKIRSFVKYFLVIFIADAIVWSAMAIVECKPIDRAWIWTEAGHCRNRELLYKAQALWSLVQIFAIISLPIGQVLKLQMPLRRRLTLLVLIVLTFGLGPSVAVIVRVIPTFPPEVYNSDLTWWLIQMQDGTAIETGLGICCTSLLAFNPLIKPLFPSISILLGESFRGSSRMAARVWPGKHRGNRSPEAAPGAMNRSAEALGPLTPCYMIHVHEEYIINDSPGLYTYLPSSPSPDLESGALECPSYTFQATDPMTTSRLCR